MNFADKKHRKQISRELLLLMSPFLLAAIVGVFFWIKAKLGPRLLGAPVAVDRAYWVGNGNVMGYSTHFDNATAQYATNVLIWNKESGELQANVTGPKLPLLPVPSPDNKVWAVWEKKNSRLQLLDPTNGFAPLGSMSAPTAKPSVDYLHWITNDKLLHLSLTTVKKARLQAQVVNTRDLTIDRKQSAIVNKSLPWLDTGIDSFQLSPDGKMALVREIGTSESIENNGSSWSAATGKRLSIISWPECREIKRLDGDLWGPANWSSDSKAVYTFSAIQYLETPLSAEIVRFDVATGKSSITPLDMTNIAGAKAADGIPIADYGRISPDNRFLVIPNIDQKKPVKGLRSFVFEVASGQRVGEIVTPAQKDPPGWQAYQRGINFSSDGRYLLHPLENGVQIWDMYQFGCVPKS